MEVSPPWRAQLPRLVERYPHFAFYPESASVWSIEEGGTGIFSRLPLEHAAIHPGAQQTRPVVEARVRVGGRPVTLRLLHPPRPGKPWRIEARNEALRRLAEDFEWDGASILMGDLNATSYSPVFGDLLTVTGLRDSRQGFGRLPSWESRKWVSGLWLCLDHVLVGDDLVVLDRRADELPGSDHRVALARLALPGAGVDPAGSAE